MKAILEPVSSANEASPQYRLSPGPENSLESVQACIDSLSAHIALVDADSTIHLVNQAWRRFADENGAHGQYWLGRRYLEICGNDPYGITAGLKHVLNGESECFELEYPCHAPTENRWFLLRITPYIGAGPFRAVIAHENVTSVKSANEERLAHERALSQVFETAIAALATALEQRDPYTAGHQRTVAELGDAIAREMELDDDVVRGVRMGGLIHDIGKIHVPSEILNRPGRLTEAELTLVREHAEAGYRIVNSIPFPWPVAEVVRHHHERWDGTGYPLGLNGTKIPIEARIIAVADVFDAITSHRPYRAGLGRDAALAELRRGRGVIYDPQVVDAFEAVLARGLPEH